MGFKRYDDEKPVIDSQAGSTVSTPHPGLHSQRFTWMKRGGGGRELSHFDRSYLCYKEILS